MERDRRRAAFEAQPTQSDDCAAAGPLILAIAGSALTPLPCAFSLTGVGGALSCGDYIETSHDCPDGAPRHLWDVGLREVIERAGGPVARRYCQAALFVLLFGSPYLPLGDPGDRRARGGRIGAARAGGQQPLVWIASTPSGGATPSPSTALLLPLDPWVSSSLSLLGVMMMLILCAYVLWLAFELPAVCMTSVSPATLRGKPPVPQSLHLILLLGHFTAASTLATPTFGRAPALLRTLPRRSGRRPAGRCAVRDVCLHAAAYLVVGLGGSTSCGPRRKTCCKAFKAGLAECSRLFHSASVSRLSSSHFAKC